jgi:hypothetical protein
VVPRRSVEEGGHYVFLLCFWGLIVCEVLVNGVT